MKKKDSSLFLTSEFARLCHTTKDTLFHYDDIGLLKPHLVKENGYRYYSIDQLYLYEIIYELKGIGCSLDEIRQYLNFQSEVTFSDFLSRKEDDLREELIRIHRSMEFMENTRHMMDDAASAVPEIPEIISLPDKYMVVTPKSSQNRLTQRRNAEVMQDHFHFCEEEMKINNFPYGHIIFRETLYSGEINDAYIFSYYPGIPDESICQKTGYRMHTDPALQPKDVRMMLQPAGTYISAYHFGSRETIGLTYQNIFQFIDKNRMRITGNAYELNIVSFLSAHDTKQRVTQVMIRVEASDRS